MMKWYKIYRIHQSKTKMAHLTLTEISLDKDGNTRIVTGGADNRLSVWSPSFFDYDKFEGIPDTDLVFDKLLDSKAIYPGF